MQETRIIGLLITDRVKESGKVQMTLAKHSKIINSRLGFHEVSKEVCSRSGIIILHLGGDASQWDLLESDLLKIEGIDLQKMNFTL